MLCFKFNQNCIINEEFDFWGLKGLFWELQKFEAVSAKNKHFVLFFRGDVTFYTKSSGLQA